MNFYTESGTYGVNTQHINDLSQPNLKAHSQVKNLIRNKNIESYGYFHTVMFMKMRNFVFNMVGYFADYADWDGQASINHRC